MATFETHLERITISFNLLSLYVYVYVPAVRIVECARLRLQLITFEGNDLI